MIDNEFKNKLAIAGVIVALMITTGCAQYVKRDEFNSTIGGLRDKDAELSGQLNDMQQLFGEMGGQLHGQFKDYDARIATIEGRLRVDMTAHFGYNESSLRAEDHEALDKFANVIRGHEKNVIVTVEGFTDPAGDPEYNKWLGLQRAEAVAAYLINEGGLAANKIRTVSYGEDSERLIQPGAWGKQGSSNRRVALVLDYVGEPIQ